LKSVTPGDPQVIFLMARVLAERNRFAEAIKMLDDLAETTPEARLPTLGQTAEWLVLQGHWREAEKRYRTLLGEVSDPSMVQRMLAQLLLRQGRRLEAAVYLHELCRVGNIEESELRSLLISLHPFSGEEASDESAPIGPLGRARYQIGQGDWDAAMGELDQVRSRRPIESALRGRILAHHQDYESLGEWVTDAPESAKEFADYWFAMGVYEANRGNHRAAVRSFCSVVLDDQTDAAAYRRMSESLLELDAEAEAQEALNRAGLIEQTQLIGERLTDDSDRDTLAMSKLSDLLDQLQRPLEALAWRAVKTVYSQSLSEQGVMEKLREINRTRMQRLEAGDFEASESFILCDIDLESLQGTD
jgi:predicted Zn-dependent protease